MLTLIPKMTILEQILKDLLNEPTKINKQVENVAQT